MTKVLNTKKEDLEIPDEWLKIIKSRMVQQKDYFWNNSIVALLQHNEKMIAKMKSVFETFEENRDEIALLWRPHPADRKHPGQSMRRQLWEAYIRQSVTNILRKAGDL